MKVYTVNGESERSMMSEVFGAFDNMEEKIKSYILKQYESIGNLYKWLNELNEVLAEAITKSQGPGDPNAMYCLTTIEFYKKVRGDWLYANGLEMSSEERNMWKKLSEEVASMFRT